MLESYLIDMDFALTRNRFSSDKSQVDEYLVGTARAGTIWASHANDSIKVVESAKIPGGSYVHVTSGNAFPITDYLDIFPDTQTKWEVSQYNALMSTGLFKGTANGTWSVIYDALSGQTSLSGIAQVYEVENFYTLRDFLIKNSNIEHFLFEIQSKLKQFFPKNKLTLELTSVPEEEDSYLTVGIVTQGNVESETSTMDRFDEEYFLDLIPMIGNKVNIMLQFT